MDIATIRQRARMARRLTEDADLQGVLDEIEEEAKAAFLVSGGDPDALTAAFRKVEAVQTLRAKIQTLTEDGLVADKREKSRGP